MTESIPQMQFQLTQLKTELHILEITSQYLEKESEKRRVVNALFPSSDPINRLYCDLDMATFHLEELVKESEDMRYECLVSGNPTDCHLYWDLQEYIHDEVVTNYTEFYWYVHTVQAALNHRDYSIPAISSTISEIQLKAEKIQTPINIALSELAKRDRELSDRDFFSEFSFRPQSLSSEYNFELPSSIIGRLMWYINPETTQLVPREVVEEYNLTFNHLNTAITNMSAKLMNVNIHRRWFKAAIFSNEHLRLVSVKCTKSDIETVKGNQTLRQATSMKINIYTKYLVTPSISGILGTTSNVDTNRDFYHTRISFSLEHA